MKLGEIGIVGVGVRVESRVLRGARFLFDGVGVDGETIELGLSARRRFRSVIVDSVSEEGPRWASFRTRGKLRRGRPMVVFDAEGEVIGSVRDATDRAHGILALFETEGRERVLVSFSAARNARVFDLVVVVDGEPSGGFERTGSTHSVLNLGAIDLDARLAVALAYALHQRLGLGAAEPAWLDASIEAV